MHKEAQVVGEPIEAGKERRLLTLQGTEQEDWEREDGGQGHMTFESPKGPGRLGIDQAGLDTNSYFNTKYNFTGIWK